MNQKHRGPVMPPVQCIEAKRLLDAYIIALSNDDAARFHVRSGEMVAEQAANVRKVLVAARDAYWEHVEQHGCRLADKAANA